jgi:NTP pyrophosphatase (non-canonical NTP hydrolase)
MESNITIKQLQQYIKIKNAAFDQKHDCILKFMEECGELARAILYNLPHAEGYNIEDTIEEEFCDVLYCLCTVANQYDVDIEKWFPVKQQKWDKNHNADYFNEFFKMK